MADTKISALTGASTPLVGTEVLPIVQSGTTVKVSVANLTSGRAISAAGITDSTITQGSVLFAGTSGLFSQSNADFFWDNSNKRLGLGTATPSTPITVYRGSAANTYIRTQNTVADIDFGVDGGGTGIMWNNANKPLAFGTNGVQRCTIAAAGDVTVNTGNLVIGTSGKGIDFSADGQAAGMTSELLDDYEEGTFSYNLSDGTNSVGPFTGTYTKIGRLVTVTFAAYASNISTLTSGNQLRMTGLPFSGLNDQLYASASPYLNSSGINYYAMIGGTTLLYYKANTTVDLSALTATDIGSPTFWSHYGSYSYQT